MELVKIAQSIGLQVSEQKVISYIGVNYNYIVTKKNVPKIAFENIGIYVFVDLNKEGIDCLNSKIPMETFNEFQSNLLSSIYFEQRNDIRWNIYLFLIVDSYKILENYPTIDIESDDNYARKYFFTEEDVINFLLRDKYINSKQIDTSQNYSNPINDWISELENVNFTGALIQGEIQKSRVSDYIYENMLFNSDVSILTNNSIDINTGNYTKYKNLTISEIHLGKFRRHCFKENEVIYPGLVNLIHGSNGSGKTSVLESIELAMTNEIKRLNDFGEKYQEYPEVGVKCNGKNSEVVIKSKKELNECKILEKVWYGTPIGRNRCTLNTNFNRFNCFSAETAYKFALEESTKEKNYSDMFARLIFDDDLVAIEKIWRRYKEEFESNEKSINKTEREARSILLSLEEELGQELKHDDRSKDLDITLNNLKIKHSISPSNNAVKNLELISSLFDNVLEHVNGLRNGFSTYNFNNITEISLKLKKQLSALEEEESKQKTEEENKSKILNNIRTLEKKLIELKSEISSIDQRRQKICSTINEWDKYKKVVLNGKMIEDYRRIKEKKAELSNIKNEIEKCIQQYFDVLQYKNLDIIIYSNEELTRITNRKNAIETKLAEHKSILKDAGERINQLKQLQIKLNNIGTDILKISNNKLNCPLCGHKYESYDDLVSKIKDCIGDLSAEETSLKESEQNIRSLVNELKDIDAMLDVNTRNQLNLSKLQEMVKNLNDIKYCEIDSNISFEDQLKGIQNVVSILANISEDIGKIDMEIAHFNNEGFNDIVITNSNSFATSDNFFLSFIDKQQPLEKFENYIINILYTYNKDKEAFDMEIANICNQIENLKTLIVINKLDEIQLNKNSIITNIGVLRSNISYVEQISKYFDLESIDNTLNWFQQFEEARLKIKIEIDNLKIVSDRIDKEKQLNAIKKELEIINIQKQRCNVVLNAFRKMKELKQYSIEFINSNIERIEYFFRLLHTPREFNNLRIIDETIVATREKDKRDVRIFEMSTGQRVSFALAVMFSTYLASSTAPKFILLDEPVANLDDLHLLNLIDILRDLALSGTQIIFTTSNPGVAGLFRRKFSFFGKEFKHFEFIRERDKQTELLTISYSPYEEEGEVLKPVS